MTLDQARANLGALVLYQPHPAARIEDGRIHSVNDHYVFVEYIPEGVVKATPPESLTFIHRPKETP